MGYGFGALKFLVTPAKGPQLVDLGQHARFGRGEQTLTDLDVRDTWEIVRRGVFLFVSNRFREIPRHLVRVGWDERAGCVRYWDGINIARRLTALLPAAIAAAGFLRQAAAQSLHFGPERR